MQGSIINSHLRGRVVVEGPALIDNSLLNGTTVIRDSPSIKSCTIAGGLVAGITTILENVTMTGYPAVKNCKITNSKLQDTVIISNSMVDNCKLSGYLNYNNVELNNETLSGDVQLEIESGK